MAQHEITKPTTLLDDTGNIAEPGFCFTNNYIYNRNSIKASKTRIKEWDFYQISNQRYTMQLTIADISYGGAADIALFDMQTGEKREVTNLSLLTFGKLGLEPNTHHPHTLVNNGSKFNLTLNAENSSFREITAQNGKDVDISLRLDFLPRHNSMVMAVPFKQEGHFYLNEKINSIAVTGHVSLRGMDVTFDPKDSFCVLDWGRGVWPYKSSWYWGNGTQRLPGGDLFGFEIGWGFGDMSAASENMIFYNGVGHKISYITLHKDEKDYMKPWYFLSDDNRFNMVMEPFFDHHTSSRVLGVAGNVCHQVFGKWSGKCIFENGAKISINDMVAFCEYSDNRW